MSFFSVFFPVFPMVFLFFLQRVGRPTPNKQKLDSVSWFACESQFINSLALNHICKSIQIHLQPWNPKTLTTNTYETSHRPVLRPSHENLRFQQRDWNKVSPAKPQLTLDFWILQNALSTPQVESLWTCFLTDCWLCVHWLHRPSHAWYILDTNNTCAFQEATWGVWAPFPLQKKHWESLGDWGDPTAWERWPKDWLKWWFVSY